MSDILIRGMEMPNGEAPLKVFIYPDGRVRVKLQGGGYLGLDAIPVPDHGRLIDADALKSDDEYFIGKQMMFGGEEIYSQSTIDRAPTIIPASKEAQT